MFVEIESPLPDDTVGPDFLVSGLLELDNTFLTLEALATAKPVVECTLYNSTNNSISMRGTITVGEGLTRAWTTNAPFDFTGQTLPLLDCRIKATIMLDGTAGDPDEVSPNDITVEADGGIDCGFNP